MASTGALAPVAGLAARLLQNTQSEGPMRFILMWTIVAEAASASAVRTRLQDEADVLSWPQENLTVPSVLDRKRSIQDMDDVCNVTCVA